MSEALAVDSMRAGWLVLTFMMLLSRVVFQAVGAEKMRAFLDAWQSGSVKRAWGAASLTFAAWLAVAAAGAAGELGTLDWVLTGLLLAVLVADGLGNVMPAGFKTFKDEMQRRWVARHEGTGREGDRHLFGTVNLLLALAAGAMAALVIAYRPIEPGLVAAAAVVALVLTTLMIRAVFHSPAALSR
jgi:hypothetical protein